MESLTEKSGDLSSDSLLMYVSADNKAKRDEWQVKLEEIAPAPKPRALEQILKERHAKPALPPRKY